MKIFVLIVLIIITLVIQHLINWASRLLIKSQGDSAGPVVICIMFVISGLLMVLFGSAIEEWGIVTFNFD